MAQSKLAQSNSSGNLGYQLKDLGPAGSGHVLYSPRKPVSSSEDHVSKTSPAVSAVPPVASHRALKSIWSLPKKRLQDFSIVKQIGHGAFATVHLVRYAGKVESEEETRQRTNGTLAELGAVPSGRQGPLNDTAWVSNKVYALKALKKHAVIAKRQVKQVLNEKKLLEVVRNVYLGGSNFIVQLMSTFQDPAHLYFVMEYVPGGDLYTLIRKHRRFPEADARLMAAELVLAVSYLHGRSIVYRDLKPENILVSATGHMKLADFGFAKRIPDRPSSSGDEIVRGSTKTFCGTPAYMAPEIVMRLPHGLPVDWFSLGVVIYEMIAGYTPFGKGSDVNAIYKNIISGVDDPHHRWSSQITPTARELLRQMMHPNPLMRSGGTNDAGAGIMKHAWFRSINWDDLIAQASNGPFVPVISSETDVRNFDEYTTESSVIRMARGEATKEPFDDEDNVFKDF
ncbi:kinase-like domain-containing protein [Cladochytrium replicatum]|nr:kinase-like domain-containing protein [Cladochytrium replicatum]